jgi:hypothetical protein
VTEAAKPREDHANQTTAAHKIVESRWQPEVDPNELFVPIAKLGDDFFDWCFRIPPPIYCDCPSSAMLSVLPGVLESVTAGVGGIVAAEHRVIVGIQDDAICTPCIWILSKKRAVLLTDRSPTETMGKILSYALTVIILHPIVAVRLNGPAYCWRAQDNGPSLFLLYPLVKMYRKNGEVVGCLHLA